MKEYKVLGIITILYVVFQLVADVTAGKIIQLGIFTVSATALYFPFTYIFGDILTEVYGFAKARKVLWQVLGASVLAGIIYQVVVLLPAAPGFEGSDAYTRVLGSVPRILVGGWLAVFVGAYLNDVIMAKMKVLTNGKHFGARAILSTVVGEGANTSIFYMVALFGILPHSILIASILSGWFLKVAVEVLMVPVTARVVHYIKRIEQEDYYDKQTNFTPFSFDEATTVPARL
ncbi:MAG: queuosine precursor transporter [Patescibacteria group bacterium]